MKIRTGNDFVFLWAIERGGVAEDFTGVLDAKITASIYGKKKDIPFTINGNIVRIEFTPFICDTTGVYNLELTYTLPDVTLSDEDRKCAVDVDAFQIVHRSAQADDASEFSITSDMAIAFQGKSAYEIWLENGNVGTEDDYIAWLRQPATDAAVLANNAAGEANTAAGLANTKAGEANEAAVLANMKAGEANTAAQNAQNVADTIDGRVTVVEEDLGQLSADVYNVKLKNLITNGNFVNGTTGWIFGSNISGVSVLDGVLTFTGAGMTNTGGNWVSQNNPQPTGNILFCAASAKSEQPGKFWIGFGYNDNGYNLTTSFSRYSHRGNNAVNKSVMGANAGNIVQVKNAINLNLTTIFGIGNEPSKDEMDTLMNILGIEYFDGEITVSAQKLMQWELKMIRQNRNAIIALGGTII